MSDPFSNVNLKNYNGNKVAAFVIQDVKDNKFITGQFDTSNEKMRTTPFLHSSVLFESFEQANNFNDTFLSYGPHKIVMIAMEVVEEF